MWIHNNHVLSAAEILDMLKSLPADTITILDGPSGCGKTSLLHALRASSIRKVETLTVEEFYERMYPRRVLDPKPERDLSHADIIAIEDIDFLKKNENLQTMAAFYIEKMMAGRACILTGIQIPTRMPVMMSGFVEHRRDVRLWNYANDDNTIMANQQ